MVMINLYHLIRLITFNIFIILLVFGFIIFFSFFKNNNSLFKLSTFFYKILMFYSSSNNKNSEVIYFSIIYLEDIYLSYDESYFYLFIYLFYIIHDKYILDFYILYHINIQLSNPF